MTLDGILGSLETALRSFLFDKKHGIVLTAGIIHRYDQTPYLALDPRMPATVMMQDHADIGSPGPLFPLLSLLDTLCTSLSACRVLFIPVSLLRPSVKALAVNPWY